MELSWPLERVVLLAANAAGWWRNCRLSFKLAAGASIMVVAGMLHLGMIVGGHIREGIVREQASAVALYMDNIVARHVQELATNSALSNDNRHALERLLSPAAMHRPVIAFRVWKGDTVVFSNEHDLIGRMFARTPARKRAQAGEVALEFAQPDGDDDEQVRSLNLPVLEVYAPVRQPGTNRIIALVETYEIAVDLSHKVWVNQLWAWVALGGIGSMVILLLFSMATTGQIEHHFLLSQIRRLTHLHAESDRRRQRISHANLQVSALNERSLRSVGNELHLGPGQQVALALLKFDALEELVASADRAMPSRAATHKAELEAIRKALNDTLKHIRTVAGSSSPIEMEELSLEHTLAKAVQRHEYRTGIPVKFESRRLPQQLSCALKAFLYRFAVEALDATHPAQSQSLSVSFDSDRLVLEITCHPDNQKADCRLTANSPSGLRERMEALGGKVQFASTADGGLSLVAELDLSDVEPVHG